MHPVSFTWNLKKGKKSTPHFVVLYSVLPLAMIGSLLQIRPISAYHTRVTLSAIVQWVHMSQFVGPMEWHTSLLVMQDVQVYMNGEKTKQTM